jgi:LPS O-antigen subunit length determinant protein (WzzB/FepE family)
MSNPQEQHQSDEIDLRDLLTTLWRKKILIAAITAIFSMTGVIYTYLAPQVWSAKAIVVAPLPTQLEQLRFRLENLVALMDIIASNQKNKASRITTDQHQAFLDTFSDTKLHRDYIQAFDSFDNKSEFLQKNGYVRPEDKKDPVTLHRTLEQMAKNIVVTQKKNEEAATLSFSSDNAQQAGHLLNEYLNFIQTREVAEKNKLLVEKITNQTNVLTLTYQILEAETLKRLQEDIARTEYALRISQTAGIDAPVESLNHQSIFAIDLGARALNEKLKILKEIKNLKLINPILADIRLQLDSLQALPREMVGFTSYHFLQSPSEPLYRDRPKRSLVVVLATLAGLMIGVLVALFWAGSPFKDGKKD